MRTFVTRMMLATWQLDHMCARVLTEEAETKTFGHALKIAQVNSRIQTARSRAWQR